ncbi:MAG: Ig-like domain-containing protein, partial [Deltaproteobacteria bacterium]|nr:Ig-like domain-containing protein [Deltaproteobacteria bacterium]
MALLPACRPNLEGASCQQDGDCPRSQFCEEQVCREGARLPRPDAGGMDADAGTGEDAGAPRCDVGAGCTLVLRAEPSTVAAGGSADLTLSVRDEWGTPVPDVPVSFEVSGPPCTLGADGGTTLAGGVLTVALSAELAGRRTVTAAAAGRYAQAEVSFLPGEWVDAGSRLQLSPAALAVGQSAALTVELLDAFGNPLPDVAVGLAVSGSGNTLGTSTGKTGPAGRFSTTLASTVAGPKTVTATVAGRSLSADVVFHAGPPASLHTGASVLPGVVGPGEETVLTVTVRDAWGNPAPGEPVSLAMSGSDNVLSPASGNTAPDGTFTASLSSTRAERKAVVVQSGAARATASFDVSPGPPSPQMSSLEAGAVDLEAGRSTWVLVNLKDVHGNPVQGAPVALSASGPAGVFGAVFGSTGPGGTLATTFSSTRAETQLLAAESGTCRVTASLRITPGAPTWADSTLEVNPPGFTAGDGAEVLVTARDAFNN